MLRSRIKQQGIDLTGKKTLIELCSDRLGVHLAEVIKRFKAGNVPDDYINPWEGGRQERSAFEKWQDVSPLMIPLSF